MSSGTLGASLLGNMLTEKGILRAGYGSKRLWINNDNNNNNNNNNNDKNNSALSFNLF